ncbi:hypothetical protein IG631_02780 [Alternaria alternata]|nr:hypothetical protein IG631_02780 [Alternaria alternata]
MLSTALWGWRCPRLNYGKFSRPINGEASLSPCTFTDTPMLGRLSFLITFQMRRELVVVGADREGRYQAKPRLLSKLGTCSIETVRNYMWDMDWVSS